MGKRLFLVCFWLWLGCHPAPKVWVTPTVVQETPAPVFLEPSKDLSNNGFPSALVDSFLRESLKARGIVALDDAEIAARISQNPLTPLPNAKTTIRFTVQEHFWRPIRTTLLIEAANIETAQIQWQVKLTYQQKGRKHRIFPSELAQILADQILTNTLPPPPTP